MFDPRRPHSRKGSTRQTRKEILLIVGNGFSLKTPHNVNIAAAITGKQHMFPLKMPLTNNAVRQYYGQK
jgi:hypothetical protein